MKSYFELLPAELIVHIEDLYKSTEKRQFADAVRKLIKYRKE